jgi:hypothetical protein
VGNGVLVFTGVLVAAGADGPSTLVDPAAYESVVWVPLLMKL